MLPNKLRIGEELHALAQASLGLGNVGYASAASMGYWTRVSNLKAVKQWLAMPWGQSEVTVTNRCRDRRCGWDRCSPGKTMRCDLLSGANGVRHVGEMKFTFGKLAPWLHGGGQTEAELQLAHYCQAVCETTHATTSGSVLVVAMNLDEHHDVTHSRARIIELPVSYSLR